MASSRQKVHWLIKNEDGRAIQLNDKDLWASFNRVEDVKDLNNKLLEEIDLVIGKFFYKVETIQGEEMRAEYINAFLDSEFESKTCNPSPATIQLMDKVHQNSPNLTTKINAICKFYSKNNDYCEKTPLFKKYGYYLAFHFNFITLATLVRSITSIKSHILFLKKIQSDVLQTGALAEKIQNFTQTLLPALSEHTFLFVETIMSLDKIMKEAVKSLQSLPDKNSDVFAIKSDFRNKFKEAISLAYTSETQKAYLEAFDRGYNGLDEVDFYNKIQFAKEALEKDKIRYIWAIFLVKSRQPALEDMSGLEHIICVYAYGSLCKGHHQMLQDELISKIADLLSTIDLYVQIFQLLYLNLSLGDEEKEIIKDLIKGEDLAEIITKEVSNLEVHKTIKVSQAKTTAMPREQLEYAKEYHAKHNEVLARIVDALNVKLLKLHKKEETINKELEEQKISKEDAQTKIEEVQQEELKILFVIGHISILLDPVYADTLTEQQLQTLIDTLERTEEKGFLRSNETGHSGTKLENIDGRMIMRVLPAKGSSEQHCGKEVDNNLFVIDKGISLKKIHDGPSKRNKMLNFYLNKPRLTEEIQRLKNLLKKMTDQRNGGDNKEEEKKDPRKPTNQERKKTKKTKKAQEFKSHYEGLE